MKKVKNFNEYHKINEAVENSPLFKEFEVYVEENLHPKFKKNCRLDSKNIIDDNISVYVSEEDYNNPPKVIDCEKVKLNFVSKSEETKNWAFEKYKFKIIYKITK